MVMLRWVAFRYKNPSSHTDNADRNTPQLWTGHAGYFAGFKIMAAAFDLDQYEGPSETDA